MMGLGGAYQGFKQAGWKGLWSAARWAWASATAASFADLIGDSVCLACGDRRGADGHHGQPFAIGRLFTNAETDSEFP